MTYIYIIYICTYNCSVQIHGELISSFILFNCSHFLWSDGDTHIFTRASNSIWLSYLPFRLRRSPCLVSILSRSFHDHGILERMWCFWWVSKIVQKKWYPKVLMFSTSTKLIKFLNYWSLKHILGEKKTNQSFSIRLHLQKHCCLVAWEVSESGRLGSPSQACFHHSRVPKVPRQDNPVTHQSINKKTDIFSNK